MKVAVVGALGKPSAYLGVVAEQHEVVAFLSTPEAYGLGPGAPIERLETHISFVWLAGARAYKLKRAVKYDYVDFSTVEARRIACEAEVRLNRRTAPCLYIGVCPVTREPGGGLALRGSGEAVEWLVEMVRFDQSLLFDQLASRHQVTIELMAPLADAILRLHAAAARRSDHGGRNGMSWVVDGNAATFTRLLSGGDRTIADRVTDASRYAIDRHPALLDARQRNGFVRLCHGDLHLRNICLFDGVPTVFDSVEFNDELSCVDVLYDLAFLLMDLWHRDLRAHANAVFNRYFVKSADIGGLPLLPLFLSCRAAIRAKTSATAAALGTSSRGADELRLATTKYLSLAEVLLHPAKPRLVAIGGFSGAGKSVLARELAPGIGAVPGALILQSDAIRKEQFGADILTRLPMAAYASEITAIVYTTVVERSKAILAAGHSVIADATYADPVQRETIAAAARDAGVAFSGLWLDAPAAVLSNRVAARAAAATDVSDATTAVLQRQLATGAGPLSDWHLMDGSCDIDSLVADAKQLFRT